MAKYKVKYQTGDDHWKTSKFRRVGAEKPHTIWVREDLWIKLRERKELTGKSLAHLVNEALYNYLIDEAQSENA